MEVKVLDSSFQVGDKIMLSVQYRNDLKDGKFSLRSDFNRMHIINHQPNIIGTVDAISSDGSIWVSFNSHALMIYKLDLHLFTKVDDNFDPVRLGLFTPGKKIILKKHLRENLKHQASNCSGDDPMLVPDAKHGLAALCTEPESIGLIQDVFIDPDDHKLCMDVLFSLKNYQSSFTFSLDGDQEFFDIIHDYKNMKQFIDPNKKYKKGEKLVYIGTTYTESELASMMTPVLTPGNIYTLLYDYEPKQGYLYLEGILEAEDPDDNWALHLDEYSFMEVEESDYDVIKDYPERMKEFVRLSIQYIMNNKSMYNSVKRNISFIEKRKEFETGLVQDEVKV